MVSYRSSIRSHVHRSFHLQKSACDWMHPDIPDVSPGIGFSVVRHAPDDCILNDRTIVRSTRGMAVET
jgi:hypothetical protein